MRFKLKRDVFSRLCEQCAQIAVIEFSHNQAVVHLHEIKIITGLFPYFFSHFKKELVQDFTCMRDGFDPVLRLHEEANLIILNLAEPLEEAQTIVKRDFNCTVTEAIANLAALSLPILEGELIGDEIIVEGLSFPKEWFAETSENIIDCRVCSEDEWQEIRRKNPQASKLKYHSRSFINYKNEIEFVFIVLLKNDLVIGLSECSIKDEMLVSSFSSIIENEQGKGYSQKIVETKISYAKSRNLALKNSSYSHDGFYKLRPNILKLCNEYSVSLVEDGFHGATQTVPEEIYSTQHDLKKKLEYNLKNNLDTLYLSGLRSISIKENEELINNFLNLNPYEFETEVNVNREWELLINFLDEKNLTQRLTKNLT